MELNKMTLEELVELEKQIKEQAIKKVKDAQTGESIKRHPYVIGKKYFFRSVTHHIVGELIDVTEHELVFRGASWIADDGRFHEMFLTGSFNEIEPFPTDLSVIVGRGSLIDCVEWTHALPTQAK